MSDARGNGHTTIDPDETETVDAPLDVRVRRLEIAIDDREAKAVAASREVKELVLASNAASLERHNDVIGWLERLAKQMPKPARRKPKRGKR